MNLQPLYDLKDRLSHAAIAGTGLIAEDFRLHRAIEALAPLAAANPVFGKISQSAKQLLSCDEEDRPGKLLDVLSLVDAVVYTQGVVNVPGEMTALEPGVRHYCQIPYSVLGPLMTALSGTGSGRLGLIRDTWNAHPEYFRDFRVLPLTVQALGDSYAELSELIEEILTEIGPDVIPLLRQNFDPEGKAPMAKRVRLIAKLVGAGANNWYLELLPHTQKEVRIAVIQALGLSQDNAETLLSLCQTEKGKVREAALHAAAKLEHPDIEALWRRELSKKPGLLHLLNGVNTPFAAELAGLAAKSRLETVLAGKTYSSHDREQIDTITFCMVGKFSPEISEFWLWAAEHMEEFAAIGPANAAMGDYSAAELLVSAAMEASMASDVPEMTALVAKMAAIAPKFFLCCQVSNELRLADPAAVYEKYAPRFQPKGLLIVETAEEKAVRLQILQAFTPISWDEERHSYVQLHHRRDALTDGAYAVIREIPPLDARWMELLCDSRTRLDGELLMLSTHSGRCDAERLIPALVSPEDAAICAAAGEWLYRRVRNTGDLTQYFYPLMNTGWKKWQGLLAHCAQKKCQASFGLCWTVLRSVPMTNKEKAAELRSVCELIDSGRVSAIQYSGLRETVLDQIAHLEADESYEL